MINKLHVYRKSVLQIKPPLQKWTQTEGPFNGQNLSEVYFGLDHTRNSFPFGQRGYIQESYGIPNCSSNGGEFLILFETERVVEVCLKSG